MNSATPVWFTVERIQRKQASFWSCQGITWTGWIRRMFAFRTPESRKEASDLGRVSASRTLAPEEEVSIGRKKVMGPG